MKGKRTKYEDDNNCKKIKKKRTSVSMILIYLNIKCFLRFFGFIFGFILRINNSLNVSEIIPSWLKAVPN